MVDGKTIAEGLATTLLLPIATIAIDYRIRFKSKNATKEELKKAIGPDCCVFSIGAIGAVYIEPHLKALYPFNALWFFAFTLLFLFFCRISCLRDENSTDPDRGLSWGICSILVVFCIMMCGYIFGEA